MVRTGLLTVGVCCLLFGSLVFGQLYDLRVLDKVAPPGGWAVIGVKQYEPRPIGSGQGCFNYGPSLGPSLGSSLFIGEPRLVVEGTNGEVTFRIDNFKPGDLLFSFEAPSPYDLALDEPFIFIALQVNPDAVTGSWETLTFNREQTFLIDEHGESHIPLIVDGRFTVGGLSIACIDPREGPIQAGQEITITGRGFQPGIQVAFNGQNSPSVIYIDETRVRAIAPFSFPAEELAVEAQNPDKNRDEFVMGRFGCFE